MNNRNLETGIVMTFNVEKVKQLRKTETHEYRAIVDMTVKYKMPDGSESEITFKKVKCSSLCSYTLISDAEGKFIGKDFSSKNTSRSYEENPFMLVKSKGDYFLYMVHENGKYYVKNILPGGQEVTTMKFKYKKKEDYVRFLDCDSLRKQPDEGTASTSAASSGNNGRVTGDLKRSVFTQPQN